MGEYFRWANIDKKQYLLPSDFDYGSKAHESLHKRNAFLRALYELLSTQWCGDQIIFVGDEGEIPPETPYSVLQKLNEQASSEDYFDYICDNYRNVSCLFKDAEVEVREEIRCYLEDLKNGHPYASVNEYGIDINDPFAGLFQKSGKDFRYIINHTKKVYYSLDITKILYKDGYPCEYADPLPMLMAYGRSVVPGAWLSDVIGVSNEIEDGYTLLQEIRCTW